MLYNLSLQLDVMCLISALAAATVFTIAAVVRGRKDERKRA